MKGMIRFASSWTMTGKCSGSIASGMILTGREGEDEGEGGKEGEEERQ